MSPTSPPETLIPLTLLPPLRLQSAVSDLNLYLSGKHFLLTDTAAAFDLTSPIPARRLGFAVGRNDDFRLCRARMHCYQSSRQMLLYFFQGAVSLYDSAD